MEKGSKRKNKQKNSRLSLSDKQYQYINKDTRQQVYDALYSLEVIQNIGTNAKVPDIWWWLDQQTKEENKKMEEQAKAIFEGKYPGYNWTKDDMKKWIQKKTKRTISERHIERILKTDPRIVKGEGHTYHIDKDARFETRYQRPDLFGHDMLHAVMEGFRTIRVSTTGKQSKIPEELIMLELGRRFAAVIQFSFIEAVRPFKDDCMKLRERNELVNYWKKKAIHLDIMFSMFVSYLANEWIAREMDQTLAPEELDESDINKMLETFKKAYPDLSENLMDARKQQPFSLDEVTRQEGKIGWVHGKTYHAGWQDYWKYLEKINPVAYKLEMERLRQELKKVRW